MNDELQITRLGWAGIQLECDGHSLVIDLFETRDAMAPFIDEVTGPLPPPSGPIDLALVTHLHADHTDARAIGSALKPDGLVLRPAPAPGDDLDRAATVMAEAGLASLEAEVRVVGNWQTQKAGPFAVTPVPATDGFGDPQVSWVVEAGGRRIFHGGDTVFHGAWWPIASKFKPFDAVFLPVNGAICNFPHRQPPSPFPASLTPEGAAVAASILGTSLAVPIHFDGIHVEGLYEQGEDPGPSFVTAAAEREIDATILEPGQPIRWAA
ncbi:MAG: MBL fold metallo-hydrolase [Thermoleophilia bacterium]|nr:MBL fold metallo-hydrolase [Thermoleophilia bacterium]